MFLFQKYFIFFLQRKRNCISVWGLIAKKSPFKGKELLAVLQNFPFSVACLFAQIYWKNIFEVSSFLLSILFTSKIFFLINLYHNVFAKWVSYTGEHHSIFHFLVGEAIIFGHHYLTRNTFAHTSCTKPTLTRVRQVYI